MSDYADHWWGLIEGAIGYIAPDSQNGKKLRPALEQVFSEARAIAGAHFAQAMSNGHAANVYGEALREIRDSTFRSATTLRGIADRALTYQANIDKEPGR